MAGPNLGFVGAVNDAFMGKLVEGIVAPWTAWAKVRDIVETQAQLRSSPVIIPSPGVIFDLMARRIIDSSLGTGILYNHGVELFNPTDDKVRTEIASCWQKVLASTLSVPSVPETIQLINRGLWKDEFKANMLRRAGGNPNFWTSAMDLYKEVPDVASIMDAVTRKRITWEDAIPLIVRAGGDPEKFDGTEYWQFNAPSVYDISAARNRLFIDDNEFRRQLAMHSIRDTQSVAIIDQLRTILPPIGDLLHFEQKEAFQPNVANPLHLYDEFPANAVPWAEQQGLRSGPGFPIVSDGKEKPATWLDLYWASRWQPLAPTQIYEMFFRLRPGRLAQYQALGLDVKPMDLDSMRRWLRYANFPPGIRDSVAAMASRPLSVREIRWAIRYNLRDAAWADEAFQDLGYLPENARLATNIAIEQRNGTRRAVLQSEEKASIKRAIDQAVLAYEDGMMSGPDTLETLRLNGMKQDLAEMIMSQADFKKSHEIIMAAVRSTRSDYMSGVLTVDETLAALLVAGLMERRARQYVNIWSIQRDRRRKTATSAQIMSWVAKGLIGADFAAARLANLGWTNPDIAIQIAEAQGRLKQLEARIQRAIETDARQASAALEREKREAQRVASQATERLNYLASRSTIQRWYRDHVIDKDEAKRMLLARGYDSTQSDRYIQDVDDTRKKPADKKAPAVDPAQKQLEHDATRAVIMKWYKDNIITADQVRQMLAERGFDSEYIERYIRDADETSKPSSNTVSGPTSGA